MFKFLTLLIYCHTLTIGQISSQCNDITPSQGDIIICDKTCQQCKIDCLNYNNCQNSYIYSAASTTEIICESQYSCSNTHIYIGDTGNYPSGYTSNDFGYKQYTYFLLKCINYQQTCNNMILVVKGSFESGAKIDGDNVNGINATFDIGINQEVLITCNNECGDTTVNCVNGDCMCSDNCSNMNGGGIVTPAPTKYPTKIPSINPTKIPTNIPTINPTKYPSVYPTKIPTKLPTINPTNIPSMYPTRNISLMPSEIPTNMPSMIPSMLPTMMPSDMTLMPSGIPTILPSMMTLVPTKNSVNPTKIPTMYPSLIPSMYPSMITKQPSLIPSMSPIDYTYTPTINTNIPTKYTDIPTTVTVMPTTMTTIKETNVYTTNMTTNMTTIMTINNVDPFLASKINTFVIILCTAIGIFLCVCLLTILLICIYKKRKNEMLSKNTMEQNNVIMSHSSLDKSNNNEIELGQTIMQLQGENDNELGKIVELFATNNNIINGEGNDNYNITGILNDKDIDNITSVNNDQDVDNIEDILINEGNNDNITKGMNEDDIMYISEMLNENEINNKIKHNKNNNNDNNVKIFGNGLKNNMNNENIIFDDMLGEMNQENDDIIYAKSLNSHQTPKTPGNNDNEYKDIINDNDAMYIAEMLAEDNMNKEILKNKNIQQNNNNNGFVNNLKFGEKNENLMFDDMFSEIEQENNDVEYAKSLSMENTITKK